MEWKSVFLVADAVALYVVGPSQRTVRCHVIQKSQLDACRHVLDVAGLYHLARCVLFSANIYFLSEMAQAALKA